MSPHVPQERHHTKVQYQLKSDQISLAQVFSKMEQVVDVLGIEDYSVSQTTLDNVRPGMAQAAGCVSPGRVAMPNGVPVPECLAGTAFGKGGGARWEHVVATAHGMLWGLSPVARMVGEGWP